MQILTDTGLDISDHQLRDIQVNFIPILITINGKTYRGGVDINHEQFYKLLTASDDLPITAPPSVEDFIATYQTLAQHDPDILSIHISSGLSKTLENAQAAIAHIPDANITLVDTKTVSGAQGWQVEAAGHAIKQSKNVTEVMAVMAKVHQATEAIFTLSNLDYLVHGGRISHLSGVIANALQLKPLLQVDKEKGIYESVGRARTFKRSVLKLADAVAEKHAPGTAIRVQISHAQAPNEVDELRDRLDTMYKCHWLPTIPLAPVLTAHTGPGLIGITFGAMNDFADIFPA